MTFNFDCMHSLVTNRFSSCEPLSCLILCPVACVVPAVKMQLSHHVRNLPWLHCAVLNLLVTSKGRQSSRPPARKIWQRISIQELAHNVLSPRLQRKVVAALVSAVCHLLVRYSPPVLVVCKFTPSIFIHRC